MSRGVAHGIGARVDTLIIDIYIRARARLRAPAWAHPPLCARARTGGAVTPPFRVQKYFWEPLARAVGGDGDRECGLDNGQELCYNGGDGGAETEKG